MCLERHIKGALDRQSAIEWEVILESCLHAPALHAVGFRIHCVDHWHHSVIRDRTPSGCSRAGQVPQRTKAHHKTRPYPARHAVRLRWLHTQRFRLFRAHELDLQPSRRTSSAHIDRPVQLGEQTTGEEDMEPEASPKRGPGFPQDDQRSGRTRWDLRRPWQVCVGYILRRRTGGLDQGSLLLGATLGRGDQVAGNKEEVRIGQL